MRVLVAGLGNMGLSHALAHHHHPEAEIVGLVNRSGRCDHPDLAPYPVYDDFYRALAATEPDLAVIATYSDSHADYACAAMEAGAHVFVEKPLATTVADARRVVDCARRLKRKLVVGYILRHHPSWQRLIAEARALGGPYVFRLNLNQQSIGATWETHKQLMQTTPPIVDCGVHYVDVMCQITDAKPLRVHGMGLRLSDEIAADMYNYGQFQVVFADGSVGWYEAGWGPMMSEVAYFVKDVISPQGAVSIMSGMHPASDSVEGHTKVGALRVHRVGEADRDVDFPGEPGHQALCNAEQAYMLRAIAEDINLTRHMEDAVASLAICLAADESIRTGRAIEL
ncbi:MAG: Gfo/Idh/MocA family oxidoreductase [Paracoccaceae bacterium]